MPTIGVGNDYHRGLEGYAAIGYVIGQEASPPLPTTIASA